MSDNSGGSCEPCKRKKCKVSTNQRISSTVYPNVLTDFFISVIANYQNVAIVLGRASNAYMQKATKGMFFIPISVPYPNIE